MGVFEKLPYLNYHDINLDWLVKQTKTNAKTNQAIMDIFHWFQDQGLVGVVTDITENADDTVKVDYVKFPDETSDDFTVYNKDGVDGLVSGLSGRIDDNDTDIGNLQGDVTGLDNRLGTAEGDITSLQTSVSSKVDKTATRLSNVDLDTIKGSGMSGFYYVSGGCTNTPILYAGLTVNCIDDNVCFQYIQNDTAEYVRQYVGGAWGSWRQLAEEKYASQSFTISDVDTNYMSSIYESYVQKYGRVCRLQLIGQTTSNVAANTNCVVMTLPSGYRPVSQVRTSAPQWSVNWNSPGAIGSTDLFVTISTAGAVTINLGSNTKLAGFVLDVTFLTA